MDDFPPTKNVGIVSPPNQQLAPENKPSHEKIIRARLVSAETSLNSRLRSFLVGRKKYAPKPNIDPRPIMQGGPLAVISGVNYPCK